MMPLSLKLFESMKWNIFSVSSTSLKMVWKDWSVWIQLLGEKKKNAELWNNILPDCINNFLSSFF